MAETKKRIVEYENSENEIILVGSMPGENRVDLVLPGGGKFVVDDADEFCVLVKKLAKDDD